MKDAFFTFILCMNRDIEASSTYETFLESNLQNLTTWITIIMTSSFAKIMQKEASYFSSTTLYTYFRK